MPTGQHTGTADDRPFCGPLDGTQSAKADTQTRRFENWENNHAAQPRLGIAIDYAFDWRLDAIRQRASSLAASLSAAPPQDLHDVSVMDLSRVKYGIGTFTIDKPEAAVAKCALAEKDMNVTVSHPSSTLLDSKAGAIPPLLRGSAHYHDDDSEVTHLLQAISNLTV